MKISARSTLLAISTTILCGLSTTACAKTSNDADNNISSMSPTEIGTINNTDLFTISKDSTAPTDFTYAAEHTINGVVSIKSFAAQRMHRFNGNDAFTDPFFEFFFGNPGRRRQQQPRQQQEEAQQQLGLGSGVIVNSDGYIVTNNHVIEGADRLEITLNDNRTFNATVIGTDATTDLALIKIEAENLPVIPIGNSEAIRVGEWVLAVGNPFGFTSTVTAGIVSAKARSISNVTHNRQLGIESFIQTDAAVNPGNSGGALVNTKGELIGINTAIYSQTGNYAGYSFAIPTSIVTKVITDIQQFGTVQRAVLGIGYSELTPKLAKEKGITAVNAGLYIGSVEELSAAMEVGLQEGDVIIAINDIETINTGQLQEQMSKYRPGDKISITYIRNNKQNKVNVTLRNTQGNTNFTKIGSMMDLGCAFQTVPKEKLTQLRIRNGVQVTGLKDGKFKAAGIKEGFIILDINNSRVSSHNDVEKIYNAIMKSDENDKVMFITGIYPTGKKVYYAVPLTD